MFKQILFKILFFLFNKIKQNYCNKIFEKLKFIYFIIQNF